MKVQLLGAAQTVTGSCVIIEANNARFAVDCGMHQGNAEIEKRNLNSALYKASKLDFILLTHAHIDHSGLLPRMVREKFTGPVYCTEPTVELLDIMLQDSAHIQEMEAEWASRKRARSGGAAVEPLYTTEDALTIIKQLKPVRFNESFSPVPGVSVCFRDAGHILGSASLEVEVTEDDKVTRLIFSGDLGKANSLLMNDPWTPSADIDYLFMESTYGDRDHKNEGASRDELAEAIRYACERGGKTIIPAFAVERTQEILHTLFLLHKEGRLPAIPVYVDSPLAIKATKIFSKYPEYFDADIQAYRKAGEDPLSLPGLKYTPEVKDSQAINAQDGPAIIISASGMCNAGRIKHHLRHNLWRPEASIVFVGYQAIGTPGRKIIDGAKSLSILGDDVVVAAKIHTIGGFSGHAGQSQILEWLKPLDRPELTVFLMHGEERAQNALEALIQERFRMLVKKPAYADVIELAPGKTPVVKVDRQLAPQRINWTFLLADTEGKLAQLRASLADVQTRSREEQVDVQEQILDLNTRFARIIANL